MNTITWLHPAPWSPIPLSHPARGYTKADDTDVRRTINEHQVDDDYYDVERTAHLDMMMEFPK